MTTQRSLPKGVGELGAALYDEERIWVRSAWRLEGEDTWRLRLLEIVAGSEPPGWDINTWRYPNLILVASELPGRYAGRWLTEGLLTVDGHQHEFSKCYDRLNWERRDSQAKTGYQVLDWPSYEVQLGQLDNNEPQRPFLSDSGAPSFASFYNAAACFFSLGTSSPWRSGSSVGRLPLDGPSGADQQGGDLRRRAAGRDRRRGAGRPHRRVGRRRARTDQDTHDSGRSGHHRFPRPRWAASGAWLVVRAGSEWLDRRFLAWPWTRGQEPGVTVEVLAKTKLDAFIAGRENDGVEFKRGIPNDEPTRAKAMKTVCAFANGAGGSLLFGITDDYQLIGVPEATAGRDIDTLSDLVDAWVEPTPSYSFEILPIDGTAMVIIELIVQAGSALFGSSRPNETRQIYVRHHSRSVPARVREIEAIVQARSATQQTWQRWRQ